MRLSQPFLTLGALRDNWTRLRSGWTFCIPRHIVVTDVVDRFSFLIKLVQISRHFFAPDSVPRPLVRIGPRTEGTKEEKRHREGWL